MKHLLLVSILIFVTTGAWAVKHVGRKRNLTISLHVAQSLITQKVFAIFGATATLLASWVIFTWLLPHYKAGIISYIIFFLLMFGFLIAALVPHVEKTKNGTLHSIAAWGMCFIIPPTIFLALFWPLSTLVRYFSIILLGVLCLLLVLAATKKELKRYFLEFQIAYLSLFFAFLILVAYF